MPTDIAPFFAKLRAGAPYNRYKLRDPTSHASGACLNWSNFQVTTKITPVDQAYYLILRLPQAPSG